jgi:hypothetical protein
VAALLGVEQAARSRLKLTRAIMNGRFMMSNLRGVLVLTIRL